MNGIGQSDVADGISYAEEVLPGYRDVLINAIHFKIDSAIFSVQFYDMIHIYNIGPVTTDHLGKRPELVFDTFKCGSQ